MNIDTIREYCLSFPDATEGLQWGDDLLFRIRGKIFASVPLDVDARARITLKSTPEKVAELLEIEGIERAAYVGRYNWVSLERFDVVPWSELKELIRESYELVAAKAPRKKASRRKSRRKPSRKRPPTAKRRN
ncbi:MAG TPA: MmcQ/YjbR family DNA-binding protein [Terriglobales bacterium]|nr:MmcQ/YjbR family DNA-binding protein [Terriglobales bacterium]